MSVSSMKKLTLLALAPDTDAIMRRLMKLKCVELRQAAPNGELASFDTAACDKARLESEKCLDVLHKAIPILARYTTRRAGIGRRVHRVSLSDFEADGQAETARRAAEETLALSSRLEALTAEQTRLRTSMEQLSPWLDYDAPLGEQTSKRTSVLFGILPPKTDAGELEGTLEASGAYIEIVLQDASGIYVALTVLQEERTALERLLHPMGFQPIGFSETSTAQSAYDAAEEGIRSLDEERYHIEERLRDLSEHLDGIEILCDIEATNAALCRQKRKLAATECCTVIEGWVPEGAAERVEEALSPFVCACELADPEEGEEPPVLLRNNAFATTFEWVIGMYSYPKYGTYDPTWIMSIFYFLIFGLMFADVGYGLLLVIGCFGGVKLLSPKEGMRRMLLMFGYCGIGCMLMGVLFGGWFGDLPTAIMDSFIYHEKGVAQTTPLGSFFANGLILNPISSSTGFLVIALAMGEIHLIAGMALSMIDTIKKGRVLEGLCSAVPFWILFAGLDLLAPAAAVDLVVADPSAVSDATRALLARLSDIGMYVLVAGLVSILLFKGVGRKGFVGWLSGGLGGLYALIGFASDLLSYSRILALGLVAGVISQVINMMTGLGASGPVGFVFMLIVMIAGHGLNLAINLLGTFVHAARLQYIEFFGKFYEDGGEPFDPLVPAEEFSEDAAEHS